MDRTKRIEDATDLSTALSGVHRRNFLKYVATAFGASLIPEALTACSSGAPAAAVGGASGLTGGVTLSTALYVTRPTDLVSLSFQFVNLAGSSGSLVRTGTGPAYVVVTFPSQHVIEQPQQPPAGSAPFATPFVASYISGPSTLAFAIPASYGSGTLTPYTLAGILELCATAPLAVATNASSAFDSVTAPLEPLVRPANGLTMARIDRLMGARDPAAAKRAAQRRAAVAEARGLRFDTNDAHPLAAPQGTAAIAPVSGQTSLEIPYRILMSPTDQAAWVLSGAPVTSPVGGRTELWHARMAMRNPLTGLADPALGAMTARALWNRDDDPSASVAPYSESTPPLANLVPLPSDRERIVQDTGNLQTSTPAPLTVDRLILSALGATFDAAGDFPSDPDDVLGWKHRIALGRDMFVKVTHAGYLLPFGHPCVYTQICERNTDPTQGAVGALYSWGVLTVRTPLVSYSQTNPAYLSLPFVGVELTDTVIRCAAFTPNPGGVVNGYVSGAGPVSVGALGIDHRGRTIKMSTPLVFVPDYATPSPTEPAIVAGFTATWNTTFGSQPYTFDGQRIAYAQPTSGKDDTSYETTSFTIQLAAPSSGTSTGGNQVPSAQSLQLNVEAIRHLTGSQSAGSTFEYHPSFLAQQGFGAPKNPNEALLALATGATAPAMTFSSPQGAAATAQPSSFAGFVAPDMSVTGLSRSLGPLAGSGSDGATGGFNPAEFFGGAANIVLFGAIPLTSILQTVASAAGPYLPKIVTQELSNAEHFLQEVIELYQLVQNLPGVVTSLLAQANADLTRAKQLAGLVTDPSPPLTPPSASDIANWNAKIASTLQPAVTGLTAILASLDTTSATSIATQALNVSTDIASLASGEISALSTLVGTSGATGDLAALLTSVEALLAATGLGAPGVITYAGGVINDLQAALAAVQGFVSVVQGVAGAVTAAEQLCTDLQSLAQGLDLAKDLSVSMTWRPLLQGLIADGIIFEPSSAQALSLSVDVRSKATLTQSAGADITIRMDQFAIGFGTQQGAPAAPAASTGNAIPWITENAYVSVVFDHMQFQMLAGQKPDVDIVFKDVNFGGPLKFIETLKNALPLDGFSDPPYLDITATGIDAGFNLTLPNVAVGIFSLENISINADIQLAFVAASPADALTFTFSFCTQDQPFLVTVAMLGGGGYLSLSMNPTGLVNVQGAVEVCAQLAINLGVAAGCVSIEVGVYFSYNAQATSTEPAGLTLGGYLRFRGEVDILGIITIAIELYMSLTYYSSTGKVVGYAEISVEIDIAFFSKTVSISYQRSFAGSNGDPTFADVMLLPEGYSAGSVLTTDPFRDYCMAYAAVAA